jgi:hypothetical protein
MSKAGAQVTVSAVLGHEAQQAWACVRSGAGDAVLSILEELP